VPHKISHISGVRRDFTFLILRVSGCRKSLRNCNREKEVKGSPEEEFFECVIFKGTKFV